MCLALYCFVYLVCLFVSVSLFVNVFGVLVCSLVGLC